MDDLAPVVVLLSALTLLTHIDLTWFTSLFFASAPEILCTTTGLHSIAVDASQILSAASFSTPEILRLRSSIFLAYFFLSAIFLHLRTCLFIFFRLISGVFSDLVTVFSALPDNLEMLNLRIYIY